MKKLFIAFLFVVRVVNSQEIVLINNLDLPQDLETVNIEVKFVNPKGKIDRRTCLAVGTRFKKIKNIFQNLIEIKVKKGESSNNDGCGIITAQDIGNKKYIVINYTDHTKTACQLSVITDKVFAELFKDEYQKDLKDGWMSYAIDLKTNIF